MTGWVASKAGLSFRCCRISSQSFPSSFLHIFTKSVKQQRHCRDCRNYELRTYVLNTSFRVRTSTAVLPQIQPLYFTLYTGSISHWLYFFKKRAVEFGVRKVSAEKLKKQPSNNQPPQPLLINPTRFMATFMALVLLF